MHRRDAQWADGEGELHLKWRHHYSRPGCNTDICMMPNKCISDSGKATEYLVYMSYVYNMAFLFLFLPPSTSCPVLSHSWLHIYSSVVLPESGPTTIALDKKKKGKGGAFDIQSVCKLYYVIYIYSRPPFYRDLDLMTLSLGNKTWFCRNYDI